MWSIKYRNNILSDIKLVYLYSTMLMMYIYSVKAYSPQALLVHCKETVLEVNVEKLK